MKRERLTSSSSVVGQTDSGAAQRFFYPKWIISLRLRSVAKVALSLDKFMANKLKEGSHWNRYNGAAVFFSMQFADV